MRVPRALHRLATVSARSATRQHSALASRGAVNALQASLVQSSLSSAAFASPSRQFSSINVNDDEDYFVAEDDDSFIQYPLPSARVRHRAPVFSADAVVDGEITSLSLDQYRGKYVVLFFYPKDFTYVCPTEIIAFNDRAGEFEELNTQLIAVSTDSAESHLAWTRLPRNKGGLGRMQIPLVADLTKIISAKYGVLIEEAGIALRGLFIIDPNGVLQQITMNNTPIGRSVDETIRLVQALQFHAEHGEVCPANWKPGDKTIIDNPKDSHKYFSTLEDEDEKDSDKGFHVVQSKQDFDSLIKSGKPVVADFMAPWCGKCTQILPFVQELAAKHAGVTFAKLDVTNPEIENLKAEYNVEALPAFHFFKDGKPHGAPVAGYKKSLLKAAVEKLA